MLTILYGCDLFLCMHIVTCILIIEILRVLLDFYPKKNLYMRDFIFVAKEHAQGWALHTTYELM